MEERFYTVRQLAEAAFNKNDITTAKILAEEYLALAEEHSTNWNYGNAIHHANLLLGRIALREGKIADAKAFLLKAGQTPGSPQLNTFGPNMLLATELLQQGEFAVVLKYLDLTRNFWRFPFRFLKLRKWRKQIRNQMIPDFGAHLAY